MGRNSHDHLRIQTHKIFVDIHLINTHLAMILVNGSFHRLLCYGGIEFIIASLPLHPLLLDLILLLENRLGRQEICFS